MTPTRAARADHDRAPVPTSRARLQAGRRRAKKRRTTGRVLGGALAGAMLAVSLVFLLAPGTLARALGTAGVVVVAFVVGASTTSLRRSPDRSRAPGRGAHRAGAGSSVVGPTPEIETKNAIETRNPIEIETKNAIETGNPIETKVVDGDVPGRVGVTGDGPTPPGAPPVVETPAANGAGPVSGSYWDRIGPRPNGSPPGRAENAPPADRRSGAARR